MTATDIRPNEAKATRKESKGAAKSGTAEKADKGKKGKGGKKKLIIILAVVLIAAGAGYKFFLAAPAKAGPPTGGEVVQLDPTTVNLTDGHYLQIAVAVQLVQGKATAAEFQGSHAAQLVIDEFSNRTESSLSSNPARKTLAADLQKQIQKAYPDEIFAIFLTKFVMQ